MMVYLKIQDIGYNIYEKDNRYKMNDFSNQIQISDKVPRPLTWIKDRRYIPTPGKAQNPFTIEVKRKQTEANNASLISIRLHASNQELKLYFQYGVKSEWKNLNEYEKAHASYNKITEENAMKYWLTMIPESYHKSLLMGEMKRLKRDGNTDRFNEVETWLDENGNLSLAQKTSVIFGDSWQQVLTQFIANLNTLMKAAREKLGSTRALIMGVAEENERICEELEKLVKGGIVPRVEQLYQLDENGRIMEQENGLPIGLGVYTQDSSVRDKADKRIQESKALRAGENWQGYF